MNKSIVIFLIGFFAGAMALTAPSVSLAADFRINYVKKQLIASGVDKEKVNELFSDKRIKQYSFNSVSYKQPNWDIVKEGLLSPYLIWAGLGYIGANKDIFEKAEKDFGVEKEVLAGIIGLETNFGRNSGNYIAFDALYSRLEQWPVAKWKGQADQLVALSKYCLNSNVDCFSIKGSYAGALGLVQFMPNSLLAYGIDGDNDGIVDLSKPVDAIPSAANFLMEHGWQQNELAALMHYYGSSTGYPDLVLAYASLLGH